MLRVFDANYSGWHALDAKGVTREMQHHIQTHCQHLNSHMLQTGQSVTSFQTRSDKTSPNMQTHFTFIKVFATSMHQAESVDIEYKRGRLYRTSDCQFLHYDGDDFGYAINTSGDSVKCSILGKTEREDGVLFAVKLAAEAAATTWMACDKGVQTRFVRMHIHILHSTTGVMFVYNDKCRSVVKINPSPPLCVNACYTSEITGKILTNAEVESFRVPNGSCGVEYTFPSLLGKVLSAALNCVVSVNLNRPTKLTNIFCR